MMEKLREVVNENEKRLHEMRFVPRSSYGRPMLWEDGGPNRNFLTYVLCDQGFAMQVLKDVGLLQSKVQWNTCGQDMTWSAESTIPEQYTWRCPKKVAGFKCSESRSINRARGSSSHLTFHEILLIKYHIVRREHAHHIQKECVAFALLRHLLQVRALLCRLL